MSSGVHIQMNGSNNVMSMSSRNGAHVQINGESLTVKPGEEFHGTVGGTRVDISANGSIRVGNGASVQKLGRATGPAERVPVPMPRGEVPQAVVVPLVNEEVTYEGLKRRVSRAFKGWVK